MTGKTLRNGEVHVADTPWCVRVDSSSSILARFRDRGEADDFATNWRYAVVFNSTPKPTILDQVRKLEPGTRFTVPFSGPGPGNIYIALGDDYIWSTTEHISFHPGGNWTRSTDKISVEVVK